MSSNINFRWLTQLPIVTKILVIAALAGLAVVAWPIAVAITFAAIVVSTIQNNAQRYALVTAMLLPALFMQGMWTNTLLKSFNFNQEPVQSKQQQTQPSQVAIADHKNQVQGAQSEQTPQVRVLQAVSGDSVDVDQQGQPFRLRLIGIQSPEEGQCFSEESEMFLNSLLQNRMVDVVTDSLLGEADQEGNLWRYVRLSDGTKVNELMLEAGLAKADSNTNYEQQDVFASLEQSAKKNNKGMWATCTEDGLPKTTPVPTQSAEPTPTPAPSTSGGTSTTVEPINPEN